MTWQDQLSDIVSQTKPLIDSSLNKEITPEMILEGVRLASSTPGRVYVTAHKYQGGLRETLDATYRDIGREPLCERCNEEPTTVLMNHSKAEAYLLCKDCFHDFEGFATRIEK